MDVVTLGAALNGSAEYVKSHFKGGSNIQIVDNPDGTQTINASGEVSSEDTVARAEIAEMKDGETLDSFGDVETALGDKADTSTTYTKTEVDTALSAKANSADVYSKTAVDTALGNKADKSATYTKTEVDTALDSKANTSDIPTVPITAIQKNGTGITPVGGTVNITVPTSAADVSALPDTTKYAAALSLTINSSTYVMTGQLKDQNGDNLGTAQTIDLPLESVVVGGSYNSQTKKVVLTLQNGNTIEFSVADLVSGLQTELSETNKLNPAYINYDSTHRAVSDAEKLEWNGKQSALTTEQLAAVNSGITEDGVEQIETNKNNISKDEAALVELVDGGAKNLWDFKNAIYSGKSADASYTKTDTDIIVSSNGAWSSVIFRVDGLITGQRYIWSLSVSDYSVQSDTCRLRISSDATSQNPIVTKTIEGNGNVNVEFVGRPELYFAYYINFSATSYQNTYKASENMICTKAAWDISHEYKPYAMSNAELTAKEQTNENDISLEQSKTTGMTEGGSNYITVNGIRVYVSSTAPTGARTGDLWIGG